MVELEEYTEHHSLL